METNSPEPVPHSRWRWLNDLRPTTTPPQWVVYALIIASTALLLMTGWIAVYEQSKRERSLATEAALLQTQDRVIALEQYVARTFEGADLVTRYLADQYLRSRPAWPTRKPIVPRLIRDPITGSGTYSVLTVVSPEGDLLATSEVRAAQPVNVSQSPAFVLQKRHPGPELVIGPPIESRVLSDTFIHLTRRVLDKGGQTLGFVAVQIRPGDLSNFVTSIRFEPTDLISVIGLDGITRVRREGNRVSFGEDLRGRLVMQMQQRSPNGSYVGPSSLDGHVRYFSHRRLANYPIFVTAGASKEAALKPVAQRSRVNQAAMGLVTLAALLIVALIIESIRRRNFHSRALAAANARLREAQRIAKIGDWGWDLRTGSIIWSDELCAMYERDGASDRLHLDDLLAYLDDDGRATLTKAVADARSTGEPQAFELKAYLPSGSVSDRQINVIPIRSESGVVTSLVGTDQDVTADRLVALLQEQVNHLSRVDAMNTMASTLAHELSQPLTAASMFLSGAERLLVSHHRDRLEMAGGAIADANQKIRSAGSIIHRVKDMMFSGRRERDQIELPRLLRESIDSLVGTGACSEGLVDVQVDEGAQLLWGDRVQVQQVLINLIRNGCEATSACDNPSVHVQARRMDDQFVRIDVTDNGPGVSRPSEIFSPFSSTKETGLGMGLSISRTIVEYHGGRIWLDETSSSGTTISFTVMAPAASSEERPDGS